MVLSSSAIRLSVLGHGGALALDNDGDHGGLEEENARLRRELAQARDQISQLRQRVENIAWYEWLGHWLGEIGAFVGSLCTLDGIMSIFTNRLFMSQLATEISQLFGAVTMTIGGVSVVTIAGCVLAVVTAASIVYWLWTTKDKQKKMKAFGRGVRDGFVNFPSEVREKLAQLFNKVFELIDRHSGKQSQSYSNHFKYFLWEWYMPVTVTMLECPLKYILAVTLFNR